MEYIIFDLEATCWKDNNSNPNEIIEIGAVKLDKKLRVLDEFSSFVRPIINPNLSQFCKELTSISQNDVEKAPLFDEAIRLFEEWIFLNVRYRYSFDDNNVYITSWGHYDKKQIVYECKLKNYRGSILTLLKNRHFSLKHYFSNLYNCGNIGLKRALKKLDIEFEGTYHRGIDDAKNISKIFIKMYSNIDFYNLNSDN